MLLTTNFLTNGVLLTFKSGQSKSRKAIDNIHFKIQLSLLTSTL